MKIVRVLYLDDPADAPWFLPDLTNQGIKLELVDIGVLGRLDVYSAPRVLRELVKELTERREVDLVIVGNNIGAGVPKAQAIADHLRDMTIIIWNEYHRGDELPYVEFGFKNFCSRDELRNLVAQVLGLNKL